MQLPEKYKASALYVTFYQQIVTAASKVCNPNIPETDTISFINMVLVQNLDDIKNNPKKYTPAFIYTLARNAAVDVTRVKNKYSVFISDTEIMNLSFDYYYEEYEDEFYDIIPDESDPVIAAALDAINLKMLEIENDPHLRAAIRYIVGKQKKLGKSHQSRYPQTLAKLRAIFKEYRYLFDIELDCNTFEDVINNDELIDYAIVKLPNGENGIYDGEKTKLRNGAVFYHFITMNNEDVVLSSKQVNSLRVVDIKPIDRDQPYRVY
ncbi:MAG: hypothetical protein J6Z29_00270 [Ruminococcus sp.]|nr:hypothetical protein [Ruminococcus sp.]